MNRRIIIGLVSGAALFGGLAFALSRTLAARNMERNSRIIEESVKRYPEEAGVDRWDRGLVRSAIVGCARGGRWDKSLADLDTAEVEHCVCLATYLWANVYPTPSAYKRASDIALLAKGTEICGLGPDSGDKSATVAQVCAHLKSLTYGPQLDPAVTDLRAHRDLSGVHSRFFNGTDACVRAFVHDDVVLPDEGKTCILRAPTHRAAIECWHTYSDEKYPGTAYYLRLKKEYVELFGRWSESG